MIINTYQCVRISRKQRGSNRIKKAIKGEKLDRRKYNHSEETDPTISQDASANEGAVQ